MFNVIPVKSEGFTVTLATTHKQQIVSLSGFVLLLSGIAVLLTGLKE